MNGNVNFGTCKSNDIRLRTFTSVFATDVARGYSLARARGKSR
jgi:hypothetical protein